MKLKTLQKKIRKLEKRLREGPAKLAKLKEKLGALEAKKAATAQARSWKVKKKSAAKPAGRTGPAVPAAKAKRTLNLSAERRATLSAAMKARWAARKAAAATSPQPVMNPQDSAVPENPPPPGF